MGGGSGGGIIQFWWMCLPEKRGVMLMASSILTSHTRDGNKTNASAWKSELSPLSFARVICEKSIGGEECILCMRMESIDNTRAASSFIRVVKHMKNTKYYTMVCMVRYIGTLFEREFYHIILYEKKLVHEEWLIDATHHHLYVFNYHIYFHNKRERNDTLKMHRRDEFIENQKLSFC